MTEKGNLYVIAAPSGTGKTTLVKALVESLHHLMVSISHTTRAKRPNEMQGVNYHFVDKTSFENMIKKGELLEHATIFDNYYGTSKHWVQETLNKGIDVILEIDWQGQEQIKQLFPHSIAMFILPPSIKDLRDRLIKRNQDHPEVIVKRLADAKETVNHISNFDYLIVNDDFSKALHDLKVIIEAGRLVESRQRIKYSKLINGLATEI